MLDRGPTPSTSSAEEFDSLHNSKSESESNEITLDNSPFLNIDESSSEETIHTPSKPLCEKERLTLGIFTIITALSQTTQNSLDMHSKHYSIPLTLLSSGLYFFSSLGLKRKYTLEGIEDTYQIIRDRTLPVEWSRISLRRNLVAAFLSALTVSFVLVNDVSLNCKSFIELPNNFGFETELHAFISPTAWNVTFAVLSGVIGTNMFFGEGKETFRTIRELFAKKEKEYSNNISKYLGHPFGFVLALCSASLDSLNSFVGLNKIYSIQSMSGQFCMGSLSLFCGVSDFSMNGQYGIESIDRFLGSFNRDKPFSFKHVAAFFAAGSASAWLSYLFIAPTVETLNAMFVDYGMDKIPFFVTPFVYILTGLGATHSFIINTAAILNFSYDIVKNTADTASCFYNKSQDYIQDNILSNHSFLFFNTSTQDNEHSIIIKEAKALPEISSDEEERDCERCRCRLF